RERHVPDRAARQRCLQPTRGAGGEVIYAWRRPGYGSSVGSGKTRHEIHGEWGATGRSHPTTSASPAVAHQRWLVSDVGCYALPASLAAVTPSAATQPLAQIAPRCEAYGLVTSSIGCRIAGSSFSGLFTRVEIGHMRISSAGNGRIRSCGS